MGDTTLLKFSTMQIFFLAISFYFILFHSEEVHSSGHTFFSFHTHPPGGKGNRKKKILYTCPFVPKLKFRSSYFGISYSKKEIIQKKQKSMYKIIHSHIYTF